MNLSKSLALAGVVALPVLMAAAFAPAAIVFADPVMTTGKPAADAKTLSETKPAAPSETKSAAPAEVKSDSPAADKKFTKAQIEAFLSKCSDEADAKGLDIKKGKGAARKAFRRECMHKFGVDPK